MIPPTILTFLLNRKHKTINISYPLLHQKDLKSGFNLIEEKIQVGSEKKGFLFKLSKRFWTAKKVTLDGISFIT